MNYFTRKSKSEWAFDILNHIFMGAVVLIIMYPIFNLVAISLSDDYYVLTSQVTVFPRGLDFDAYRQAFENKMLIRSFLNTVGVALVGGILSLIAMSFAAYPLSFSNFAGKKALSIMIAFTLWFNGGMIPSFLVIRNLGLIDSLWSLVLSTLMSAYHIIILRSFFSTIPSSLIESAKIDGANDFRILFKVVWPLSKPALALIMLWVVVGHWNSFFTPLLYLNSNEKFTLQLVLRDIVMLASGSLYGMESGIQTADTVSNSAISEQTKNAVVFIAMVPMLILYPFLQKYFVGGMMLGAVKE